MQKKLQKVWGQILEIIKDNIQNQNKYETWFLPIIPLQLEKSSNDIYELILEVPSNFYFEFLEAHYSDLIKKAMNVAIGQKSKLLYSVKVINNDISKESITTTMPSEPVDSSNKIISLPLESDKIINPMALPGLPRKVIIDDRLQKTWNFERFVEGDLNRLGRSVGLAIAQNPGDNSYNPLFIYGKSGYGKTHLAQAIGNEIRKNFPNKQILYMDAQLFETQFTESIRKNTRNDFMNFFQILDVLIFDDIHILSKKEKTQEAFFHIFNHLQTQQKQLIFTSDRNLHDIEGIEERLVTSFRWGIVVELSDPDFVTRLAIVKQYAENCGINNKMKIDENVYEYIAAYVISPREMIGILNSLIAVANFDHKKIDIETAKDTIQKIVKNTEKNITMDFIINYVSNYYNINQESVRSESRKKEIVTVRHISMYLCKKHTKHSLQEIGQFMGGKNHATVIHAQKKVNDMKETDKDFKKDLARLEQKFI